ncbi:ribonuclease H-like domain-containing protein [Tanacetum coccineum]
MILGCSDRTANILNKPPPEGKTKRVATLRSSNGFVGIKRHLSAVEVTAASPVTTEEYVQKKNDVKARSMLLMALPNEHLMTFNQYKDAKTLFAGIQKRFSGNEATKKTQKTLLKHMYENFSTPSTESLDSIFNRLQKIVSQLAILNENISQEDLNLKFLRSLPSEGNTHVMVWRNKPDLDTMSFDDLYNNFKIVEHEVKGTASSSSRSSSQNMAFVSSPSSTNEFNTSYGVSTTNTQVSPARTQVSTASTQVSTANFSDDIVYAFLASQPNGSQLVYEDLEQIHEDDIEEMDLKWHLALLSTRTRRFFQKTGRKITINASDTAVYDNSRRTVNVEETSSKAMGAIDGAGFDWSYMAEDEVPTNMALMAFSNFEGEVNPTHAYYNGSRTSQDIEDQSWSTSIKTRIQRRHLQHWKRVGCHFIMLYLYLLGTLPKAVNTTRPNLAVVNAIRANQVNAIKALACWVWRPTKLNSTSITLKKHNYVDARGRSNVARTPQQNGVAERRNKTLIEAARTMLADSKLPTTFWAKAVNTACYVQNREIGSRQDYILMPLWKNGLLFESSSKNASDDEPQPSSDAGKKDDEGVNKESGIDDQERPKNSTQDVNTAGPSFTAALLEATYADFFGDETEVDMSNITTTYQTRRMTKTTNEQGFISATYEGKTHEDLHTCLFSYFLSQVEPKKVYKNKKDKRGFIVRNNARPVAQGYTQEEGIDYDDVFAPVARIEAIRLLLAYASFMNFVVYKMDVKSVFLYGKIEEEVYVCQPSRLEYLEFLDRDYKVEKALYGLHQAPRACYDTLSTYLLENRFQRGTIDKTLFIKKVMQKEDRIFISQDKYVDEILKKFGFLTMRIASTPMETSKPLLKDAEAEDVDVYLYRSMIGSLMYLTAF